MKLFKIFIAAFLVGSAMGCTSIPFNTIQSSSVVSTPTISFPELNGLWEGSLIADASEAPLYLRLYITDNNVKVWLVDSGEWVEAKPGIFQIHKLLCNAVIYSTDFGVGDVEDDVWVESWAILATLRTSNELLVTWSRMVNNVNMPIDEASSKFSSQLMGSMKRVEKSQ